MRQDSRSSQRAFVARAHRRSIRDEAGRRSKTASSRRGAGAWCDGVTCCSWRRRCDSAAMACSRTSSVRRLDVAEPRIRVYRWSIGVRGRDLGLSRELRTAVSWCKALLRAASALGGRDRRRRRRCGGKATAAMAASREGRRAAFRTRSHCCEKSRPASHDRLASGPGTVVPRSCARFCRRSTLGQQIEEFARLDSERRCARAPKRSLRATCRSSNSAVYTAQVGRLSSCSSAESWFANSVSPGCGRTSSGAAPVSRRRAPPPEYRRDGQGTGALLT